MRISNVTSVNDVCPCGNYRRGVFRRDKAVFAGRGISLPGLAITAGVIVAAFGLGLVAGWITDGLPERLHAEPSPTPTPTPSFGLSPTVEPSLPPLSPITRTLTSDDRAAGIVTTDYVVRGDGTFSVVPGTDVPDENKGDVRWVSVAVEDGVSSDPVALRDFVLGVLNDNRAWGTGGHLQYVATDGVADYRVLLASPYTTAAVCANPHVASPAGPVVEASPSPSPSPSPSASASATPSAPSGAVNDVTEPTPDSPYDHLCTKDGVIVLSSYDWTAGYPAYGDDYTGAREYMLLHRLGHIKGREDSECKSGRAKVMDMQRDELPEGCEVNPWPYPDAPEVLPSPSPTPSPSAAAQ
jgi:hypothetical protein